MVFLEQLVGDYWHSIPFCEPCVKKVVESNNFRLSRMIILMSCLMSHHPNGGPSHSFLHGPWQLGNPVIQPQSALLAWLPFSVRCHLSLPLCYVFLHLR